MPTPPQEHAERFVAMWQQRYGASPPRYCEIDDGDSVDAQWVNDRHRLLVNFDGDSEISYAAIERGENGDSYSGMIDPDDSAGWLWEWFIGNHTGVAAPKRPPKPEPKG